MQLHSSDSPRVIAVTADSRDMNLMAKPMRQLSDKPLAAETAVH